VLKDEPYQETKQEIKSNFLFHRWTVDVINDLIIGINEFLQSLNIVIPNNANVPSLFATKIPFRSTSIRWAIKWTLLEMMRRRMTISSTKFVKRCCEARFCLKWFRTIGIPTNLGRAIKQISRSSASLPESISHAVDLKDFFEKYTEHLQKQGKLYPHCKYKSKPIALDENGHCLDSYCSKKPYNAPCPLATLKFGTT